MQDIDLLQELNNISKTHTLQRDEIDQIMIEFAGRITRSLKIERMSVWLLDFDKREMTSMGEYDRRDESFQKDNVIPMSLCPEYFEALEKDEILYVPNVMESPITEGLKESYNKPAGVITLLDIPLRFDGQMIGVMCFEKTGDEIKVFDPKERFFAHAISMVFSSNLEARKRRALQAHLDKELHEKETLLKEIHHRVKNNLQVISSILNLQSSFVSDENTLGILQESRNRIRSMAIIHENLYRTEDFASIKFDNYLRNLTANLIASYSVDRKIEFDADLQEVDLVLDQAIPCGLLTNELITNALKYAWEGLEGASKIRLKLEQEEAMIKLTIADNGIGLPQEFEEMQSDTLGLQLVTTLAEQLDAELKVSTKEGTEFQLTFENVKRVTIHPGTES